MDTYAYTFKRISIPSFVPSYQAIEVPLFVPSKVPRYRIPSNEGTHSLDR